MDLATPRSLPVVGETPLQLAPLGMRPVDFKGFSIRRIRLQRPGVTRNQPADPLLAFFPSEVSLGSLGSRVSA
jgi:hypothetical protein